MSIIYIFLEIIAIVIFLLVKKTDKKENILFWIVFSLITMICYNTFITFILSTLQIKMTLTNLSIILIIISGIFSFIIYKNKKIQRYYIEKKDIIVCIIVIIAIIIIAYMQYGFPFSIKYSITDGLIHYDATINFCNTSNLLKGITISNTIGMYTSETFMTASYVNSGIFIKSMSCFITNAQEQYSAFVIFDLLVFYISCMLFYFLVKGNKKKKSNFIIAIVFLFFYIIGYQLNSLFSGFCYLSIGLAIMISIIIYMKELYYYRLRYKTNLLIIMLLNFGLFFSYFFFVPIFYLAIFLTQIIKKKKRKKEKIITQNNIITYMYIFIIPFICGIYYFFLKGIFQNKIIIIEQSINVDGYIYSNFITNFIFFIPFVIYFLIDKIKKKEFSFEFNLFLIEILFLITLGIGNICGLVSNYYFYKAYYLLWIIVLVTSARAVNMLIKKRKINKIIITYFAIYLIVGIISVSIFKESLIIFDVYNDNIKKLEDKDIILIDKSFFEIVDYSNNNIEDKDKIYILTSKKIGRNYALYTMFQNYNVIIQSVLNIEEDDDNYNIEKWLENKKDKKYFVYYNEDLPEQILDYSSNQYKIIIHNNVGTMIERIE